MQTKIQNSSVKENSFKETVETIRFFSFVGTINDEKIKTEVNTLLAERTEKEANIWDNTAFGRNNWRSVETVIFF